MGFRKLLGALGVAAVLVVSSCGDNPQSKTRVKLDDSSSLHGTDANGDGLRDDVAAAIEAMDVPQEWKPPLIEFAKGEDQAMDLTDDREEARAHSRETDLILACPGEEIDSPEFDETIIVVQSFVLNTDERRDAYDKYDFLLSGGSFELPVCDYES